MSLRRKVLNGLKWSILAKATVQLISWISTFYVIRALTPEDYGIIAISTVLFAFINIFAANSFITALVKSQNINRAISSQVFTVSFLFYVAFSIVLMFVANKIASLYGVPQLEEVLYALALMAPLTSFSIIPSAVLNIAMDFKAKAICEGVSAMAGTIVAFTLAYLGYGYWALVYSTATTLLILIISLNYYAKSAYALTCNFDALKSFMPSVWQLQTYELIWFSYNKLDALILGKYLGIDKLGIYNVAIEVASIPMSKVSSILNQVGFSAFASLKNDDRDMGHYYLSRGMKLLSLISFPVFFGISAVSEELVSVVLGDKWQESSVIISIFAIVFPFRMISGVLYNYSIAHCESKFILKNVVLTSSLVIAAILVGVQYGLVATAAGWVTGFMIAFIIVIFRFKLILAIESKLLLIWLSPMFVSILMWLVVYFSSDYLNIVVTSVLGILLIKIFIGVIFIAALYIKMYLADFQTVFGK